jgi:hypothetical protein
MPLAAKALVSKGKGGSSKAMGVLRLKQFRLGD